MNQRQNASPGTARAALSLLLASALLLVCTTAAATTYRWVDENGQIHYSDTPPERAAESSVEEIEIRTTNVFSRPGPSATESAAAVLDAQAAEEAEALPLEETPAYTELSIVSPTQEETLSNIGGELRVNVRIEPQLDQRHYFIVYLDGAPVTPPTRSRSILLREVYRGEHTVHVAVQRDAGMEVARTQTVSFFVRQSTVAR